MSVSTPATPVVVNSRNGTSNPSDPTPLTTQQMLREVSNLEKVFDERMRAMEKSFETYREEGVRLAELRQEPVDCLKEVLETRMEASDRALVLLQAQTDKVPSDTDLAVGRLQSLHEEKFNTMREKFGAIQTQFISLKELIDQASEKDSKALDAALATTKEGANKETERLMEAINKQALGFKEQLQQESNLNRESTNGSNIKMDTLKERLDRIEGRSGGMGAIIGWIFGAAGFVAAVGAVVALIVQT